MIVEKLNRDEWETLGRKLYGEDKDKWEFRCIFCHRVQSAESIGADQAGGIYSQRYGKLKKGDGFYPEQCCYSPTCNYVANGLITTGILLVLDPSKPHNEAMKENCCYVLPFAKAEEEQ